jgi:hypothetical protein
MARYYLKAIFWNTLDYQKPSGVRATSGFPKERGYGHEEWNNADFMTFEDRGHRFRVFHTEGMGNAPVGEDDGQIFLFIYASHNGMQQLVGAVGKATYLVLEDRKPERERLAKLLGIQGLWRDAWSLPIVKECHGNNERRFIRRWNDEVSWIPNWKCPEELFFWPEKPVTLDSMRISGKTRLTPRFGSYTEIGPDAAMRVLESVPVEARTDAWSRIRTEIDVSFDNERADVADIRAAKRLSETMKQALIDARCGQGHFRNQLMMQWDYSCAVTGCNQMEVLRASHIKPWRESSNEERLNSRNGLMLSANLDALFDRGLISFQKSGDMLISGQVTQEARKLLGLPAKLRRKPNLEEEFLHFHRTRVFMQ